jgi:ATP-binding cassette subfamily B protein
LQKWNGIVLELRPNSQKIKPEIESIVEEHLKKSRGIFSRFYLPIIKPYKKSIIEILLASIIIQLLGLSIPFFTQSIIDNVLATSNYKLLWAILAGMFWIFFIQMILMYTRSLLILNFKINFEYLFFSKYFKYFISLKQKYFDSHKREDFIIRFNQNLAIRNITSAHFIESFIDILFLMLYIPILFFYNFFFGICKFNYHSNIFFNNRGFYIKN